MNDQHEVPHMHFFQSFFLRRFAEILTRELSACAAVFFDVRSLDLAEASQGVKNKARKNHPMKVSCYSSNVVRFRGYHRFSPQRLRKTFEDSYCGPVYGAKLTKPCIITPFHRIHSCSIHGRRIPSPRISRGVVVEESAIGILSARPLSNNSEISCFL